MNLLLIQEELFTELHLDRDKETINAKDYVYVKKELTSNVVSIHSYKQGYVTKVEEREGERVCSVFFGRTLEQYYDYQLTKRLP